MFVSQSVNACNELAAALCHGKIRQTGVMCLCFYVTSKTNTNMFLIDYQTIIKHLISQTKASLPLHELRNVPQSISAQQILGPLYAQTRTKLPYYRAL